MFRTGLEELLEKVALVAGAPTAVHPEAMHPQYAARVARRAPAAPGVVPMGAQRLNMQMPDGSPVGRPAVQQAGVRADMRQRNRQNNWERANDPLMREVHEMADQIPHGSATLPTPPAAPGPGRLQRAGTSLGAGMATAGRGLRRGALLAGAGVLGAGALGAGLEYGKDKKRDQLTYAPMNGSFAG